MNGALLPSPASLEELRTAILIDRQTIAVASLAGSVQASNNQGKLLLGGRARRKQTIIRGSAKWSHDVLLPVTPATAALGSQCDGTGEALVLQVGACNLRCWFCFVDRDLIRADPLHLEQLCVSDIIGLCHHPGVPCDVIHVSGGEPLLVPEFIRSLQEQSGNGLSPGGPYLWIESNLSVPPRALPVPAVKALERLLDGERVGMVGCIRSIDPEDYPDAAGVPQYAWQQQLIVARQLHTMGADLYLTVVLLVRHLNDIESRLRRLLDTLVEQVGEWVLQRMVPIEIKLYPALAARSSPQRRALLESQYQVLPIWWEVLSEYLTQSPFDVLPIRKVGTGR